MSFQKVILASEVGDTICRQKVVCYLVCKLKIAMSCYERQVQPGILSTQRSFGQRGCVVKRDLYKKYIYLLIYSLKI